MMKFINQTKSTSQNKNKKEKPMHTPFAAKTEQTTSRRTIAISIVAATIVLGNVASTVINLA